MIWRKDTPTESPIVAYIEGSNIPEVLLLAKEPYPHYYDNAGEEVPTRMIQKWASLSETSTPSNLDNAAEKYADSMGLKDFDKVRAISDFKAGVEWTMQQGFTVEGIARPDDCEIWINFPDTNIKDGDKVIVQVRKK